VVVLGAELEDRAAEEPELHPDLHQEGEVTERHRLEARDRGADVAATAVLGGEAQAGGTRLRHHADQFEDPLAELRCRHLDRLVQHVGVLSEVLAGHLPDVGVLPVQERGEGWHVDCWCLLWHGGNSAVLPGCRHSATGG
jgi:hypothetical protein